MLRSGVALALAAAALTTQAPAAVAGHDAARCRFNSVSQATLTGSGNWEGAIEGFASGAPGEAVKVECVVRVNGVTAGTSGIGEGSGVAVVAALLTYHAEDFDVVYLCTRAFTTAHGWKESCWGGGWDPEWVSQLGWRLQELALYLADYGIDLVNEFVIMYVDPALCDVLDDHPGTYGAVTINEQGDVFVGVDWVWDCPPYDLSGS